MGYPIFIRGGSLINLLHLAVHQNKQAKKIILYNHNGMDIEFMRLHAIGFDITLPNLFNCQFAVKELDVRFLKGENLFCRC